MHERRDVVRPHVEQGPAALGIEERRIRVEDLRPLPLERGLAEQRPPDVTARDRPFRGLHSRAEHGVRSHADAKARGLRPLEQPTGLLPADPDRLLGPDVLARGDDRLGDLDVRRGDREIDHDVDVGVVEHHVDPTEARDAVLLGLRLRPLLEEIRDREDADVRERGEVRQVLIADVAGTDDADTHGARHQPATFSSR